MPTEAVYLAWGKLLAELPGLLDAADLHDRRAVDESRLYMGM
jgi:hypothetical protein